MMNEYFTSTNLSLCLGFPHRYGPSPEQLKLLPAALYSFALRLETEKDWSDAGYDQWNDFHLTTKLPQIAVRTDVPQVVMVVHADALRLLWHGLLTYPADFGSPCYVQITPWLVHLKNKLRQSDLLADENAEQLELALDRVYVDPPSVVFVGTDPEVAKRIRFGSSVAVDATVEKRLRTKPSRGPAYILFQRE